METSSSETLAPENLMKEAVKRMKQWEIIDSTIEQFEKEHLVSFSRHGMQGANYWLPDRLKEIVARFENNGDKLVYYVIETKYIDPDDSTQTITMYSFLYVSSRIDEWLDDEDDILHDTAFVYVLNASCPQNSEFGTIGIKKINGGLVRTA